MNGLQLAHQLKAREPALPIFMLTSRQRCAYREGSPGLWNNCRLFQLDDLTTLIANARAVCGLE